MKAYFFKTTRATVTLDHVIPNIAHGHGGPALRILLKYRKRRGILTAEVKNVFG